MKALITVNLSSFIQLICKIGVENGLEYHLMK